MGYTTTFFGKFKIIPELKASDLVYLQQFLGEDKRSHLEWPKNDYLEDLCYSIDLELTKDLQYLQWDGSEKSYYMESQVNYIICVMRKKIVDFRLEGKLSAQGENITDVWELVINEDGWAVKNKLPIKGKVITCPYCEQEFILEENK